MHILPQYDLYIRRADRAMRLVVRDTGSVVATREAFSTSGRTRIEGVFVSPRSATGVFLMPDEIIFTDEFVIYPIKLAVSQKTCHAAKRIQRMGFLS